MVNFYCYSFDLQGNVFDRKMNTLSDMTIKINNEIYMSDENGYFNISRINGVIDFSAFREGFETYSKQLDINRDSQFSFMMEEYIEKKSVKISDIFKSTTSLYGISGILNMVDSNILPSEKTLISYSFSKTDFIFSGQDFHRNSSNLKIASGIENNIEAGFSFFVTEDSSFNVVSEDNVFSLKKNFGTFEGIDFAVSYITRGGNDSLILSADYYAEKDLLGIINLVYDIDADKSKADIGLKYVINDRIQFEGELVMGFFNRKAQSVFKFVSSREEYNIFFFYLDDILNNYQITGAGFDYSF
jgi:hypothetical protein